MNNELTMSILTGLLVLIGIAQVMMLLSQKRQNQLALLQDYRSRWRNCKKQWAIMVYIGREEGDYYQTADTKLIKELEKLKKQSSLSYPTVWALESISAVSNIFSDVCIKILQGQLEIKDVYPLFGSQLLRHSRPLRVLFDIYYHESYGSMESKKHGQIKVEAQDWLIYHDGIRRRCLILLDLLWAEGVRIEDICPSDIKNAAQAKKNTAEKSHKRLSTEIKKVNNSMSLFKVRKLKSHLKHSQYNKFFWQKGINEVELNERIDKWETMLLRGRKL